MLQAENIRSARCSRGVLSKLLAARKANFHLCSCSQKNRSARHARECSQRPSVTPTRHGRTQKATFSDKDEYTVSLVHLNDISSQSCEKWLIRGSSGGTSISHTNPWSQYYPEQIYQQNCPQRSLLTLTLSSITIIILPYHHHHHRHHNHHQHSLIIIIIIINSGSCSTSRSIIISTISIIIASTSSPLSLSLSSSSSSSSSLSSSLSSS